MISRYQTCRSYSARDASEPGGGEGESDRGDAERERGGEAAVHRGGKEEAVVRQLRTGGNVLLLLEHGLLRLSVPGVALADAHARVLATVRARAAGDAQTFKSASRIKRTEGLERVDWCKSAGWRFDRFSF